MDQILHLVFALIAALNAATGAPVDVNHLPDRPPIVAPTAESNSIFLATDTPAPTAALQTTIITGTITTVQSNLIVVSGQSITIAPDAEIKGHLQVGAVVQVNAVIHTDGSVDANTVQVSEDTGTPTTAAIPTQQAQVTETPGAQATEIPEATATNLPGPQATPPPVQATEPTEVQSTPVPVQATQPPEGQPTVKPTPQPQPTEPPEGQPTVKPTPQPQPTEPPESQPTSKPSPQPQPTATPGD